MYDLEVVSLHKIYSGAAVVEDVNFALPRGEMVAVLGPSGCGKTTTLRMVAGFVTPTSGQIRLRGQDITDLAPNHRNMGMVFQSYALFPHMNVFDNIAFGLRAHQVAKSEIPARVGKYLDVVGLGALHQRFPKELSGGQQQRVALARVLALHPQILLFDEPLSNLDAKLRVQMRGEIRRLQKASGISALFVTHDQEEAMVIADRIVVMNKGRIEQIGTPAEIYDEPKSRFVADFIGAGNLISGAINDGRFVTAKGLAVALNPSRSSGQRGEAVLSIRPEKISFAGSAEESVSGVIVSAVNLGSIQETEVELPSGDIFKVHEQCRAGFRRREVGEQVSIAWQPDDAKLLFN